MPIYEYECCRMDCQHKFEFLHATQRFVVPRCPKCGNAAKRIEFSVPSPFQWWHRQIS